MVEDDPVLEALERIEALVKPDAPMFPPLLRFPLVPGRVSVSPLYGLMNTPYDLQVHVAVIDQNRIELALLSPEGYRSRSIQLVVTHG